MTEKQRDPAVEGGVEWGLRENRNTQTKKHKERTRERSVPVLKHGRGIDTAGSLLLPLTEAFHHSPHLHAEEHPEYSARANEEEEEEDVFVDCVEGGAEEEWHLPYPPAPWRRVQAT